MLATLAYAIARRYANDPRFSFGAGKLRDLDYRPSARASGRSRI